MPTKIVRFARINNEDVHYAGHYPLPSIETNDVVEFQTLTLDITLKLRPVLQAKFQNGPAQMQITPATPHCMTALQSISLMQEFQKSNITVKAIDLTDQAEVNYFFQTIQPCTP